MLALVELAGCFTFRVSFGDSSKVVEPQLEHRRRSVLTDLCCFSILSFRLGLPGPFVMFLHDQPGMSMLPHAEQLHNVFCSLDDPSPDEAVLASLRWADTAGEETRSSEAAVSRYFARALCCASDFISDCET